MCEIDFLCALYLQGSSRKGPIQGLWSCRQRRWAAFLIWLRCAHGSGELDQTSIGGVLHRLRYPVLMDIALSLSRACYPAMSNSLIGERGKGAVINPSITLKQKA